MGPLEGLFGATWGLLAPSWAPGGLRAPDWAENTMFYEGFLALQGRLRDIEGQRGTNGARTGHEQGRVGAAHLAGEGPLAGDKRGYKYPLGGIWKEKKS